MGLCWQRQAVVSSLSAQAKVHTTLAVVLLCLQQGCLCVTWAYISSNKEAAAVHSCWCACVCPARTGAEDTRTGKTNAEKVIK